MVVRALGAQGAMADAQDIYRKQKELFSEALELPPDERAAFLDRACGDDSTLRAAVDQLLAADSQSADAFDLESPRTLSQRAPSFDVPERIGPYRIDGLLGEGGMGVVFRAEQERPRRTVALKVLRAGLVDADTLERFEREADVLGRLNHPGIAQVFEAGMAELGGAKVPFFALELVDGVPLVEYAQREDLSLERRIELLIDVCNAVEHAHEKAIVHRDLKPANILVDTNGTVKVLDFGIAVATDEARTTAMRTASGMVLGTVAYMSPEQAMGNGSYDKRADVYALGVMAYELVSGRLPHELQKLALPIALRTVAEVEPPRLGAIAPGVAVDLETIVTKALEKEPARRYASAADLGADLRRFLDDEPITARPPSTIYQLVKFTRRNRALVGGLMTTFLALAVGLVVSLIQRADALEARELAEEREKTANREAAKARNLNDFILRDLLASPNPWEERGDIRVSEVLDGAALRIDERFDGEPVLEADVRATLGGSYQVRGLFEPAKEQLDEALRLRRELYPDGHEELATVLLERGRVALDMSEPDLALDLCSEALTMNRELHGDDDLRVADALLYLSRAFTANGEYGRGRELMDECLAIRKQHFDGDHESIAVALREIGGIAYYARDFEAAIEWNEQALSMRQRLNGPESPYVAVAKNDLGECVLSLREAEEKTRGLQLVEDALRIFEASLGSEHPITIRTRRNLGVHLAGEGAAQRAEELLRTANEQSDRILGPRHVDSVQTANSLAYFLLGTEQLEECREVLEDLLPRSREALGETHPDTASAVFNLAWLRKKSGDLEGAAELFREAFASFSTAYGPDVRATLDANTDLVGVLVDLGEIDEANERLDDVLAHRDVLGSAEYERVAISAAQFANALGAEAIARDDLERGVHCLEASYELCLMLFSPTDWRTADTQSQLGSAMAKLGLHDDAEIHLIEAFEAFDETGGRPQMLAGARARLIEFYEMLGEPERADVFRE